MGTWKFMSACGGGRARVKGAGLKSSGSRRGTVARDLGIAREPIHRHFLCGHFAKSTAMKSLRTLALVSALLMVFGMPVPRAQADDKPAAPHVPFPFLFTAYAGDAKKDGPEKMEFQINTVDRRQPAEFLKIGYIISKTKWKLAKFQFKLRRDPETNEAEDASELTLINSETNKGVVLRLNHMTDTAAHPPKK